MGVNDVIRQAFVEAEQYQADWDAYRAGGDDGIPPRRDLELEALAEILSGERLVHAHAYRQDEILQLIRLAEEFGFRVATFQHVLEGYKVAKEIAEHGAAASTFSDWWGYKMEAYDAIPYNAAIMVEKGVSVSINSDSNEEMRHLNQEAAKTMKWGGMTETQALSMITINPARQLGVADQVGSIEVGKDADIVIFDRHPLDNFSIPQKTYVDGKLYFDIEGDRERQRAIDDEKEALTSETGGRRVTTDAPDVEPSREGGVR
jgi:imidazolonepropionase-like amidohydrolase